MSFYDLNVPYPASVLNCQARICSATAVARDLAKLGYGLVAFNHVVEDKIPARLVPLDIPENLPILALRRITVVINDSTPVHALFAQLATLPPLEASLKHDSTPTCPSPTLPPRYEIVALSPITEKQWQSCCTSYDCDIISLDMSTRLPFYFKHSIVNEAIRRGIHFEITYSSALKDASARKVFISNATNLLRVTLGKNVIMSSGAESILSCRGPYDVINLGCMLGMNQDIARHAISKHCRSAVIHAHTRMSTYRGAISAISIDKLPIEDTWKARQLDDFIKISEDEFLAISENEE